MVYIGQCKEIKINTMLNIGKLQQVVSALQVQSLTDCAMRELREETGINETNLVELGRVVQHNHHSIYVDYIVITDWDKSNITLQQGETQDYKWVDKDTLKNMKSNELVTRRMQLFIKELR